jgi:probable F420-dependent oxidoreductase
MPYAAGMSVRVGLGFLQFPFSGPEAFWRWVDQCEDTGVDSLWLSERIVSTQNYLEPLSALAAIAGRTRRIKFGMSTVVLPLRDPTILAKECATIDYLSMGRFLPMFGVGNDIAPEWQAMNVSPKTRGSKSNEMLGLLTRLWSEDSVTHHGRYFDLDNVTIAPKPIQDPLPLWIGGSSEAAIERTARYGTGWIAGGAQTPAQLGRVVSAIRDKAAEYERPIDDDHYGAGFSFRFGTWDEAPVLRQVAAFAQRAPGADPRAFMAVGGPDDVVQLVKVFRAVGISKFVLRPIATDDEDMLHQSRILADEVIPLVNVLA